MKAFVINLDHATERWENLREEASGIGFDVVRVPAVFGDHLPQPFDGYDADGYRRKHGKQTNPREIGCYQSHLKALEAFLHSDDQYGMILEDDAEFLPNAKPLIEQAVQKGGSKLWDILRLSGLHRGSPAKITELAHGHALAINLSRQTGAGAYVVNRKAAKQLSAKLVPMDLPYDHAFDREWTMGFKAMSLIPYPIAQNARYQTSIEHTRKYGPSRYLTVFPYRAINETCRLAFRGLQYGKAKLKTLTNAA